MVRELNKAKLLSILDAVEHIIYYFVALALVVPVGMLFVSAAMSVLQASEVGILRRYFRSSTVYCWSSSWSNCSTRSGSRCGSVEALLPNRFCWWG